MPRRSSAGDTRRRCLRACDNCKRRKERCNGIQPCGRCSPHPDSDELSSAPVPHLSRLIQDAKGKFLFIGDSANLSLLQNIRRVVEASIGACAFTADPLRHLMVEETPQGQTHWLDSHLNGPVTKPTLAEATELVSQYMLATNCVLDLFDEAELLEHLPHWLDSNSQSTDSFGSILYLVLAIGAQTSSEEKDVSAEQYFNYGRYLTALSYTEEPSIPTVQSYALITMFMLGAARRNAAFMNLGIAVRAAYAMGLHKKEVSDLFGGNERRTRERLWKVIRVLDLFMSAALGRPPSTSETRDTTSTENYSASARLVTIFEHILTDVYCQRKISTEVVGRISKMHRCWTARLREGLKVDGIHPSDELLPGPRPNIGLYHLKEAYYWTIILLTRPFLVEHVSLRVSNTRPNRRSADPFSEATSNLTLVDACVGSAVRTVDLLKPLIGYSNVPKRLPFVLNSVFIAALVLGLAFFGDLDKSFPLQGSLQDAQALLQSFQLHDALAKRYLMIIEYLQVACSLYVERRDRRKMESHSKDIGGIFGIIDEDQVSVQQQPRVGAIGRRRPSAQKSNVAMTRRSAAPMAIEQSNESIDGQQQPLSQCGVTTSSITWNMLEDNNAIVPQDSEDVLLDGFDVYGDGAIEFSPRTLWFDSYEDNNPLFSMVPTGQLNRL
ncbi:hypothetical protein DL98DRAFT_618773 [Cadophora sp. DSE1049]|nr:hypothetical protein DL98DRAFT_618773 [Cadophora sp. DSE1049]